MAPGKLTEKKYFLLLVKSILQMVSHILVKADMHSDIALETAAIFFLANRYLKQGISSEYVMIDFICTSLLDL